MILVANTAFSSLEDLPFDLRQRRILTYISSSENPDRASPKKILARSLAQAVKAILLSRRELTKAPSLPFPDVRISCSAKSFLETGAPRSKTFHFLQLRIENHSLQHLFLAGFAIQLNNGRRLALLKDHFTGEIWNDRRLETGNSETWNIDPKYLNRDPSEMVCPMVTDRIGREFLGDAVEFQQALALAISLA